MVREIISTSRFAAFILCQIQDKVHIVRQQNLVVFHVPLDLVDEPVKVRKDIAIVQVCIGKNFLEMRQSATTPMKISHMTYLLLVEEI